MKKLFFGVVMSVLILGSFSEANAANLVGPTKEDHNINISTTDNFENLYTAGANVNINGDTSGDLTAAGALVTLVGNVEQDLLTVGGTLNLSGDIYGDARLLGGNVSITSNILGDLVLVGGNVDISEKASIGGDLVLAGGNVSVSAPVDGNVKIAGGSVSINSKVVGSVYVVSSDSLVFGPKAEVLGRVVYKGAKPAVVSEGAKVGNIEYTEFVKRNFKNKFRYLTSIGFLIQLLAWFFVGFVFLKYKKNIALQIVENIQTKPWLSVGWGFGTAVLVPVAVVLMFLTVVGYYAAVLLGVYFLLILLLAGIFTALSLGYMILKYLNKDGSEIPDWQVVVVGVVIFNLLKFVPILGWLILVVVFLQVFGSQIMILKNKFISKD